jgi:hypothetical protein
LQSTEPHKTRFDTRKFIFFIFKDIPAHLLTKFPSLSDGAWVASLLCILQIFVFHFWSKWGKKRVWRFNDPKKAPVKSFILMQCFLLFYSR